MEIFHEEFKQLFFLNFSHFITLSLWLHNDEHHPKRVQDTGTASHFTTVYSFQLHTGKHKKYHILILHT